MLSGGQWVGVLMVVVPVVVLAIVAWVIFAAVRAGTRHGQRPSALPGGSMPGWWPDPFGRHEVRWWDGRAWTADVSDGGVRSVDPV